jgi:hypothetical protein
MFQVSLFLSPKHLIINLKMKNLLLFLAATIIFTTNSFSQIKQGTWMAGGLLRINGYSNSVNYPNSNNGPGNSKVHTVYIYSIVGYFLRDNILIGLSPNYAHGRSYSNSIVGANYNIGKSNYNVYGISPFIRKYKQLFNSKAYIFGQASLNLSYSRNYSYNDTPLTTSSSRMTGNSEGISLSPGINYFISERIALEVIFAGLYLSTSNTTTTNYNGSVTPNNNGRRCDYNFNLNLASINLGIQFFIGKKQDAAKKEGI